MSNKLRIIGLLSGILVFAIPFYIHYMYLLNSFYHYGAPINDMGIFGRVSWRGDLWLTTPAAFANYSFYAVHCAPILSILTAISHIIPLEMTEYYATFLASVYASMSLAFFYAITKFTGSTNITATILFVIMSILLAFNNSIMTGIWHGHIEYAIPLGICVFMIAYINEQRRLMVAAFIFTLIVREDGGFHLTAILGLVALLKLKKTRSFASIRVEIIYIVIAVLYSIFAVWISFYMRDYYGSTFQVIYSGMDPYAHLTGELLLKRLALIAEERIDLWVGFLASLALTIYYRSPYLIIGYLAYLPWFILNWTAFNDNTGKLYAYYSFPFILSLIWPIMGLMLVRKESNISLGYKPIIIAQVIMIAASMITLGYGDKSIKFGPMYNAQWGSYEEQLSTKNRDQVLKFFAGVENGEGNLGVVMADQGSITMVKSGKYQGKDLLRMEKDEPVDTIIAMIPNKDFIPEEIKKQIDKNQLRFKFCMKDSSICLFTNRNAAELKSQ